MPFLPIIAAAYTFTATATGLEKGSPVEFFLAGEGTDRDYETLFVVKEGAGEFCRNIEKSGIPRGKATELSRSTLWPVGCPVEFSPKLDEFIDIQLPDGFEYPEIVYTGGLRDSTNNVVAASTMPLAILSLYSLSQSPLAFNGVYEQGMVYNSFRVKKNLKKGEQIKFTVSWDEKKMPKSVEFTIEPGKGAEIIKKLKKLSKESELDAKVKFASSMKFEEAKAIAQALAMIDSKTVKINGRFDKSLFYRTFLPLEKWRNRQDRLMQPFEYVLGQVDELYYIMEDWKVEGLDPKLTPQKINFVDTGKYPRTNTCFIYADKDMSIGRIEDAMNKISTPNIINWYIFEK